VRSLALAEQEAQSPPQLAVLTASKMNVALVGKLFVQRLMNPVIEKTS